MEIKRLVFIPLGAYKDKLENYSYIKVLSNNCYSSVKLSVNYDRYKYKHLLDFNNILEAELIKTRKNWILKDILNSNIWYKPKEFQDYLKLSELNKVIASYYYENHEVNLMNYLLEISRNGRIDLLTLEEIKVEIYNRVGVFDKN